MSLLIEKPNQKKTDKFRAESDENGQYENGQPENGNSQNSNSQNSNSQNSNSQNDHYILQSEYAPHDGKRVSEEEYWALYYERGNVEGDASYEWNNGILEAKPMASRRQARLYNWFLEILFHFLKVNPVAEVMNLEIGFRMERDDPKKPGEKKKATRKPDIGIIREDNPVRWLDEERSYKGICDMIIESLSDSDQSEIDRDTIAKKAEYEAAGVREYYILDPEGDNQYFYRLSTTGQYVEVAPDNDIIRSTVLPGFQFRLSDFSRQPSLEEMAEDDVYKDFILLAYQTALRKAEEADVRADEEQRRADEEQRRADEEQRRAEEADARAEEERLRAEEADARARESAALVERMAAKMRALGIDESELE